VIDLHSHVLPGVDDGAKDLDETMQILRDAAADGTQTIAATPHVRHDYPTAPETMEAGVSEVRAAAEGIVSVLPGGEIDLLELDRPLEELTRFGLGGNPKYLLLEMPYLGWPLALHDEIFRLRAAGITPVLAHPERNPEVQERPELLEQTDAGGALVQLTAASVDGRHGRGPQRCARTLLSRQLAHLMASDAHGPGIRAVGMGNAVRALDDSVLARWLTFEVPRTIIEGGIMPPFPKPARRRALFSRRNPSGTRDRE
jgi:protein-tyrosine phosphatase